MSDRIPLKEPYVLANCCQPMPGEEIVGYYSHDNVLKVHRAGCSNLARAESSRLVTLSWDDIRAEQPYEPGYDYADLDEIDFRMLDHHDRLGIDYSLKVARVLTVERETAFDRHRKLREMNLLDRVEPTIVQYRKGVVDNKWIKHRNHTYYDLTDKGRAYLAYHRKSRK
ncbi:DUF2250 domain-containing protein [bacterium]|nr:DUF2250 domain-containing protein [bacterium]